MKHLPLTILAAAALALAILAPADHVTAAEATKKPPKDRVVAMYFHRTQRCPTCRKMGSYTEEAIKTGFSQQLKDRTVQFHYVDFQNKKNAALVKGYKIKGPALVVAHIKDKKVKEYRNLEKIWTKVREKPEFVKYVRENIDKYRK